MTGARLKFFTVNKEGSKAVRIEKQGTEQEADIAIRTRSYIYKSWTSFKRTIIEYGREIEKWFPVVLLSYHFEGAPQRFHPQIHANQKEWSSFPYVRTNLTLFSPCQVSPVWVWFKLWWVTSAENHKISKFKVVVCFFLGGVSFL